VFRSGHRLLLEKAAAAVAHPLLDAHAGALVEGCFREDEYSIGLTHFAYAAPWRAGRLFARAVRGHASSAREGFWWLGRAAHLVSEMASPAHAQGSFHWYGDAFELYLEQHCDELRGLPVADVPPDGAEALARGLALEARRHHADRTRNLPGYLAYRLGLRRRPTEAEVLAQVRELVPLGAGYTAALFRRFLAEVRG
jgi:hypothetical protein